MKNKENITNYIFLFIFALGIMLIYLVQLKYPDPQPNPREEILYNAFEAFFSIGIGWVLQRISSRKEFQESLKQFALSAYRRISDIEKSVNRIKNAIEKARASYSREKVHELDILSIVAEELSSTVNSSIADWIDVIGEELSKKERIVELQKEQQTLKSVVSNNPDRLDANNRIKELQEEIDTLKSKLPYLLKENIIRPNYSSTEAINFVVDHFHRESRSHSCITIQVGTNDANLEKMLDAIIPVSVVLSISLMQSDLYLLSKNGETVGRIINPFPKIEDTDFVNALVSVLGTVTKLTSSLSDDVIFSKPLVLNKARIRKISNGILELAIPAEDENFSAG